MLYGHFTKPQMWSITVVITVTSYNIADHSFNAHSELLIVKLIHPWVVTAKLIERGTSWVLEQWLLITITTLTKLQGARARGDAMRVGISRAN
jgi:hypothetical protein